jgi:signal transduction histidine kinase
VTPRRRDRDEEERARRERLAYVGALAAGLVHEVRTPLHAIQLNAQMLVEDVERVPEPSRTRFERRAGRIYNEVKALTKTLEAFLTFARPPRPDPTPTDLNHFLRELIEFVSPEMEEAEIAIDAHFAPEMYPVVLDHNQFTHVVLNLLRNAREAIEQRREKEEAPPPGVIRLRTAEDESTVSLTVEDSGIGIPEGDEERIFEVFYTTKQKGTGLGLGIVRRIVEDHRGTIRAEGLEAGGARFTVELPRGRFLPFTEDGADDPAPPASEAPPTSDPFQSPA